jgi:hypothetical protein
MSTAAPTDETHTALRRVAALLKRANETPDVERRRALEDILGQEALKLTSGAEGGPSSDDIEQVAALVVAALQEDEEPVRETLFDLLGERLTAALGQP